ncbi:hypothetical protein GRI62_00690 [Erythrobacter arachoides]|uniref:Uncharacterized protein n=1 Tax=Aurantiacibacter arachoides TaxID=1850444 RepID=A0A844ZY04_9SPHN|nr:hypothetical protein [Aurantiacibacter arachoides]MXO92122.1 hypothetical protein [Aurantiacibacter arachoides]GGD59541.1 hypothetical protein GCM10011411_19670 [Aurantiacibacter arachoides]
MDNADEAKLKHELGNALQKTQALESLVERAADQLDALADADCAEPAKAKAHEQAERLRKVLGS